jgi:hypothetical protein
LAASLRIHGPPGNTATMIQRSTSATERWFVPAGPAAPYGDALMSVLCVRPVPFL